MTAEAVAFWVLAALSVVAALGVVLLKNVFRTAAALVICFLAIAGLYAAGDVRAKPLYQIVTAAADGANAAVSAGKYLEQ